MISIKQQPYNYTPAFNDIIFQIESNYNNIQYFLVSVLNARNEVVLSNLKLYSTPVNRRAATINLTQIVRNNVSTSVVNTNNFVEYFEDTFAYKFIIVEYLFSNNQTVSGEVFYSNVFYAYNGYVEQHKFSEYKNDYYKTYWLTNKPLISNTTADAMEWLYYFNANEVEHAVITLSYVDRGANTVIPLNRSYTNGRLNISLPALVAAGININGLRWFSVELTKNNTDLGASYWPVTGKIIRRIQPVNCNTTTVNLIFENQHGGMDTISLLNPTENLNVIRNTIKVNPYSIIDGVYTNQTGGIYNHTDRIISTTSESEYTVVSDYVSNEVAAWMPELVKSKKVLLVLPSGRLLPVKMIDTNLKIQTTKYSSGMNQYTFRFTAESNIKFQV